MLHSIRERVEKFFTAIFQLNMISQASFRQHRHIIQHHLTMTRRLLLLVADGRHLQLQQASRCIICLPHQPPPTTPSNGQLGFFLKGVAKQVIEVHLHTVGRMAMNEIPFGLESTQLPLQKEPKMIYFILKILQYYLSVIKLVHM